MTTDNIREQKDKLKNLLSMYSNLHNSSLKSSGKELEMITLKMNVAKKEMLKCTFRVGRLLKQLEEKV